MFEKSIAVTSNTLHDTPGQVHLADGALPHVAYEYSELKFVALTKSQNAA